MDYEEKKRRQNLRVIASEAVMVLTVILTVIVLVLVVSGYWLNSNFEVERQGLLQVSSVPTGSYVLIDGSEPSWFQRTNTSKMLPIGEHTVRVERDGYDSWEKTVNISEGLLFRLHYPRLFPLEREPEVVYDTLGVTKTFLSENHETLLLYSGDLSTLDTTLYEKIPETTPDLSIQMPDWQTIDLNSDTPEPRTMTLRNLYSFFEKPEEPKEKKDPLEGYAVEREFAEDDELLFSRFYEDNYLTVVSGQTVSVFLKEKPEPVFEASLSFLPEETKPGHNGEFVAFFSGQNVATLDMETMSLKEWTMDGATHGWIDNDMIYSVKEGELFVYDFDGLNRRSLAHNVSERFPVMITNDKWLYYFSDSKLVREKL